MASKRKRAAPKKAGRLPPPKERRVSDFSEDDSSPSSSPVTGLSRPHGTGTGRREAPNNLSPSSSSTPPNSRRHEKRRTNNPPRYRPPSRVLTEITKLKSSTNLLIPAAPFARLVREITADLTNCTEIRYQKRALMALHEAAEAFIIGLCEDAYLCALHAKRVTLFAKDLRLAYRIRGDVERYGM